MNALITYMLKYTAWMCPFCDGGATGVNRVKEELFNEQFWTRAAAVLAPFPIILGIVLLIYFWPFRSANSLGQ